MIEFKAECGHTVRAKDEDAGGVVRCSYCGRKAAVPDEGDDDLDFLFADVDPAKLRSGSAVKRRSRRPRRLFARRPRTPGQFNPFSLVLRMCYAALLICIVVFVAKKFVIPAVQKGFHGRPTQQRAVEAPPERSDSGQRTGRKGLTGISGRPGLYVASVPSDATYYCIEESKAPPRGRISSVEGHYHRQADGDLLRLPEGVYAVEVVLPTNDPRLNDRTLPYYDKYRELRRALQTATEEECQTMLEAFFVPDEAWPVFVDRSGERTYIVRQYRGVKVDNERQSEGVRALFLPKIMVPGQNTFSIAQLVTHYLPKDRRYVFDEVYVRDELDFFQVPQADRGFVLDGLARIGIMPYVAADGSTRLVKLGIHDGECWKKDLRETSP